MKTQKLTVTLTMAGALAMATSLAAQPAAPAQAARAAQEAQSVVAAQAADIAQAVRAAQDARSVVAAHATEIAQAAQDARTVWTADLARTVEAARAAGEGAWSIARTAANGWEQMSDRDRETSRAQRERDDAQREKEREASYYDQGQGALDSSRWDRAVSYFDRVIELKGAKADAALYWKAYAQNKLGQRPEALGTITVILKDYPKSRYLSDAKALEVEVKRNSSTPIDPAAESDEELKIMALNALQNSASEEAVPMLQKVLQGTGSPKLKAQALFVLAQSNSPKAREVLVNIAKGGGNPDLQMRAVRYLGIHGGRESRAALSDIYASSSDLDMKKRILNAFMQGGDKDRLLTAAQTEQNPDLRATAVQLLGNLGAHEELWTMYQKESSVDVKKGIIRALFTGGSVTRLSELARGEQNPELRLLAVRNLALMGGKRNGDVLVEIYNSDKNPDIRKAVINGLFTSNNPEALVTLARKEQDITLKKEMVQRLSNMHSKVATDYLLELLNK